jgi:IS30 family transposase
MIVQNKSKHFIHLSQEERVKIYGYLQQGKKKYQISKLLGRHHTTIGREIENNSIDYGLDRKKYTPIVAQKKYNERRKKALQTHIKLRKNHKLRSKIYSLLSDESKCR